MLRTEKRHNGQTILSIRTKLTIESVGPTLNISAGGMCMLTSEQLRGGLRLSLTFNLPDDTVPITCKGQVVSCKPSTIDPELFEVGLQFTEVGDKDRARVLQFVKEYLD